MNFKEKDLKKTILVTGGAGFVGSVLIPLLIEQGYKVRAYDSLLYGIEPVMGLFLNKNFELIKGDIRDVDRVKKYSEGVDAVIHLASLVGYPICKKNEKEAMSVNSYGTQAVLNSIPSKVPFIFASTGSCYGNLEGICKEDLPLKPLTIYGKSKAKAEEFIQKRGNYVIYRFATGYGVSPRLRLDLMINDFCYKAVKEKNLIVYEKHFKRTFIHVYDMARSFLFAVENFDKMKNECFNVGSEKLNLTKEQIAEYIRRFVPYYLHYADFGHDEDKRDYSVSYEKIRKLGFETKISMEVGIIQLIRLFKALEIENKYSNV